MNRNQFSIFCEENNLEPADAGSNWKRAGYDGQFCCAVINDENDFAKIKHLIENEDAYLASAIIKDGQQWYEHYRQYSARIFEDTAEAVAKKLAEQFSNFLHSKDCVCYYRESEIKLRDRLLSENQKLENESDDDFYIRIVDAYEEAEGFCLPPKYVNEAGHWDDCKEILLSDIEIEKGIWSYRYDNWVEKVILVLIDQED